MFKVAQASPDDAIGYPPSCARDGLARLNWTKGGQGTDDALPIQASDEHSHDRTCWGKFGSESRHVLGNDMPLLIVVGSHKDAAGARPDLLAQVAVRILAKRLAFRFAKFPIPKLDREIL